MIRTEMKNVCHLRTVGKIIMELKLRDPIPVLYVHFQLLEIILLMTDVKISKLCLGT